MKTKCMHRSDILAKAMKSFWIGIGVGALLGCIIFFTYLVVNVFLLPLIKHSRKDSKKDAASPGLGLRAIPQQAPCNPRQPIQPQVSNSTTVSTLSQGVRNDRGQQRTQEPCIEPHQLQQGTQGLRNRGEQQQVQNTDDSEYPYEYFDVHLSLPDGNQNADRSTYLDFDENPFRQNHDEPEGIPMYSNNSLHPHQHEEPAYANANMLKLSNTEYGCSASPYNVDPLVADHTYDDNGYMFMNKGVHETSPSRLLSP